MRGEERRGEGGRGEKTTNLAHELGHVIRGILKGRVLFNGLPLRLANGVCDPTVLEEGTRKLDPAKYAATNRQFYNEQRGGAG